MRLTRPSQIPSVPILWLVSRCGRTKSVRPVSLFVVKSLPKFRVHKRVEEQPPATGRLMHGGAVRVLAGCKGEGKGSGKLERSAHHGRNEPAALLRLSDAGPQGRMAVTIPRPSVFRRSRGWIRIQEKSSVRMVSPWRTSSFLCPAEILTPPRWESAGACSHGLVIESVSRLLMAERRNVIR